MRRRIGADSFITRDTRTNAAPGADRRRTPARRSPSGRSDGRADGRLLRRSGAGEVVWQTRGCAAAGRYEHPLYWAQSTIGEQLRPRFRNRPCGCAWRCRGWWRILTIVSTRPTSTPKCAPTYALEGGGW